MVHRTCSTPRRRSSRDVSQFRVSLRVSFGCQMQAPGGGGAPPGTAEPCEMSARVSPCQLAPGPCHAEGRGFESRHPLRRKPRSGGVFCCLCSSRRTLLSTSRATSTACSGPRQRQAPLRRDRFIAGCRRVSGWYPSSGRTVSRCLLTRRATCTTRATPTGRRSDTRRTGSLHKTRAFRGRSVGAPPSTPAV